MPGLSGIVAVFPEMELTRCVEELSALKAADPQEDLLNDSL